MLLAGQKVYVGPFLKKSDRPVDKESRFTNVYVKNLPDSVDDQKLNQMFSEHGNVTSAVVMKVPRHTCRCVAKTACYQLDIYFLACLQLFAVASACQRACAMICNSLLSAYQQHCCHGLQVKKVHAEH